MKDLKILYIEDDKGNREDLVDLLSGLVINECKITIEGEELFENATQRIYNEGFHLVILDLYKGRAGDGGEMLGLTTLEDVKSHIFVPIIFYSGNISAVRELKSQVIGVATKGGVEGIDELKNEIGRLTSHNLPFINENIYKFINGKIKEYFWGTIQKNNTTFKPDNNDFSLGYLLLRNIGNSLYRDNIYKILGDNSIAEDKVHPMEFYIYPRKDDVEYENGDILENNESKNVYVILTPSCDLISTETRQRKAERVLLVKAKCLTEMDEYIAYKGKQNNDNKKRLSKIINSAKSDRYFFIPGTPFITNRVIDFQDKSMVDYGELNANFKRIAKLDNPFAQSMTASFIRYYNRIGFPDIDVDYVLSKL